MAALRVIVPLLLLAATVRAEVNPLLIEVAERWADVRYRWSFVQLAREYDGANVVEERLERYDPSRGDERRWTLLKLNGRAPTADEWEAWNKRKNRPRKREVRPLGEIVDLENAVLTKEDAHSASFELPLYRTVAWLIPGEKIALSVTINKQTHAVERGRVEINAPFNIALGLAKVIDLDIDLELPDDASATDPAQAHGKAYAVVNKFGRRMEYTWSEFTRVQIPGEPAADHPTPPR